jgi:hypothetical protein
MDRGVAGQCGGHIQSRRGLPQGGEQAGEAVHAERVFGVEQIDRCGGVTHATGEKQPVAEAGAAPAPDSTRPGPAYGGDVDQQRARRGDDVAPGKPGAGALGQRLHADEELLGLIDGPGGVDADGAEDGQRLPPHRRDITQRGGGGSAANLAGRHPLTAEVAALDHGVGGQEHAEALAGLKHGGIVTDARRERGVGMGHQPPDAVDEAEFTDVGEVHSDGCRRGRVMVRTGLFG